MDRVEALQADLLACREQLEHERNVANQAIETLTRIAKERDDYHAREVAWAKQRLIIERKMRGDTGADGRPIPGTIEPTQAYAPTEGSEIVSSAAARIMSNSGPFT